MVAVQVGTQTPQAMRFDPSCTTIAWPTLLAAEIPEWTPAIVPVTAPAPSVTSVLVSHGSAGLA